MDIAFVHPDLGIGGAERLIVDLAVGLQDKVNSVHIYTSHHSKDHCFPETKNELEVTVFGDFFPREIFGKLHIVFAIIRSLWLCLRLFFISFKTKYHAIIVDQLSIGIPILRLTGAKIIFYCHFPDKMLTKRESKLKKLYRIPFDLLEELTTSLAHVVVVNSNFTKSVFKKEFPRIRREPRVVYPGVRYEEYKGEDLIRLAKDQRILLSINRFEQKKNIEIAIKAFSQGNFNAVLVIAGGYDARVEENKSVLKALQLECDVCNLQHVVVRKEHCDVTAKVVFMPSISEKMKQYLLSRASVLIYTPSFEHFGIVPVEAMYARVPVVAMNNGGPSESVIHLETGYLCNGVSDFVDGINWCLNLSVAKRMKLGERAQERAVEKFSRDSLVQGIVDCL